MIFTVFQSVVKVKKMKDLSLVFLFFKFILFNIYYFTIRAICHRLGCTESKICERRPHRIEHYFTVVNSSKEKSSVFENILSEGSVTYEIHKFDYQHFRFVRGNNGVDIFMENLPRGDTTLEILLDVYKGDRKTKTKKIFHVYVENCF
jgi:hypothetical protein